MVKKQFLLCFCLNLCVCSLNAFFKYQSITINQSKETITPRLTHSKTAAPSQHQLHKIFFLCSFPNLSPFHLPQLLFSFNPKMQIQTILFIFFTCSANWVLCLGSKSEDCTPPNCGNGSGISYPFWVVDKQPDYCGYKNFQITCSEKNQVLTISNNDYVVKDIFDSNPSFLVVNSAIYNDECPIFMYKLALDRTSSFSLTSDYFNFSFLYHCTLEPSVQMFNFSIECLAIPLIIHLMSFITSI